MSNVNYKFNFGGNQKKVSGSVFVAGVLGLLTAMAVLFFGTAWVIMLLMGALHAEVAASIPAISYFGACLITLALGVVSSFFKSNK